MSQYLFTFSEMTRNHIFHSQWDPDVLGVDLDISLFKVKLAHALTIKETIVLSLLSIPLSCMQYINGDGVWAPSYTLGHKLGTTKFEIENIFHIALFSC